jgi:hypothetical protein
MRTVTPAPRLASQLAKNILINPGFETWQRGNGAFTASGTFTADEWLMSIEPGGTLSVSKETTIKKYGLSSVKCIYTHNAAASAIRQGIEVWPDIQGQTLTFSVWVKSSVVGGVYLTINDYLIPPDTGSGVASSRNVTTDWEQLTVVYTTRTGLGLNPQGVHNFGITVSCAFDVSGTYYFDGAALAIGEYYDGLDFFPPNTAEDLLRCKRFFDMGEESVTGVSRNVRNWQGSDNILINGGFETWQRGASFSGTSGRFIADEWKAQNTILSCAYARSAAAMVGNYCVQVTVPPLQTGTALYQGVECFKSLAGLTVTLSAWVKTSVASDVRLIIRDWDGSMVGTSVSSFHSGSGSWERLTVIRTISSGVQLYPAAPSGFPHTFGVEISVWSQSPNSTWFVDGATLVVGNCPEGVPFVPMNPADDMQRCQRFYQADTDGYKTIPAWTGPGTNQLMDCVKFPVYMYTTPTITATIIGLSLLQDPSQGSGTVTVDQSNWSAIVATPSNAGFWYHSERNVINAGYNNVRYAINWSAEIT